MNNTKTPSLYYRYFVYSSEEEALNTRINGASSATGTVIVHGAPKPYTSILKDMEHAKPDAIIVIQGDIRKIRYTPPVRKSQ